MGSKFRKGTVEATRAAMLRNEVESFNADYCATLDAGEIESWPEFFTEDCIYRVTARENYDMDLPVGLVYAEGVAMLHDRAVAISRTQMFAPRQMRHLVTNVRIISEAADGTIEAEANFALLQTLVEGPTTIHLAGVYYDKFKRLNGRLLLQDRQVIHDTAILANDLVYPV